MVKLPVGIKNVFETSPSMKTELWVQLPNGAEIVARTCDQIVKGNHFAAVGQQNGNRTNGNR